MEEGIRYERQMPYGGIVSMLVDNGGRSNLTLIEYARSCKSEGYITDILIDKYAKQHMIEYIPVINR